MFRALGVSKGSVSLIEGTKNHRRFFSFFSCAAAGVAPDGAAQLFSGLFSIVFLAWASRAKSFSNSLAKFLRTEANQEWHRGRFSTLDTGKVNVYNIVCFKEWYDTVTSVINWVHDDIF